MQNCIDKIELDTSVYSFFSLQKLSAIENFDISYIPISARILLENLLRSVAKEQATQDQIKNFIKKVLITKDSKDLLCEMPFFPARVLMQDFTGVPAVVDLASMRDALFAIGGDPSKINPKIPVDLVIDHSVQVATYGNDSALSINTKIEMENNSERYEFLKWGQEALENFRVVPPGNGICHQVNLEYLASVVCIEKGEIYSDTVVGTDSHTTMINGLSVLGWGVGGIEAEAAMLGCPIPVNVPDIIGVKLEGALKEGVNATDLVLYIVELLRKNNVVGKFVEFFGEGLDEITLEDRATIANMAPEYGATCGFFPIDEKTLAYLHATGRDKNHINLIKQYAKKQHLWREDGENFIFSKLLHFDLSTVNSSISGPKRPQDRILLQDASLNFQNALQSLNQNPDNIGRKFQYNKDEAQSNAAIKSQNKEDILENGSVVISAITSCTNTSNPFAMIGAGIIAKNAVQLGISVKPWVKTSIAPGSKVVGEYLVKSGLDKYLEKLGFYIVGYGCTTCIGNSGPLLPEIENVIHSNNLVVCSVLSGNRNFEGRIHPLVRANYLASPMLCIVYAIAGNMNIDITKEAIAINENGKEVYLKDIWPKGSEIRDVISSYITPSIFREKYENVFKGDSAWQNIKVQGSDLYEWRESSYIKNPPFFEALKSNNLQNNTKDIQDARILAIFGDSITTDHISPAGSISANSPAASYLLQMNIPKEDFNSYGSRRGNHEVMMRGTFANIRIKNKILKGKEGGYTMYFPDQQEMSIYDASMLYKKQNTPLVIFAGKEYGTGSSRDWAAKGTMLLGVKAVIAESFERIHRSNLIGMGVIPLLLEDKDMLSVLSGDEIISLDGISKINMRSLVICNIYTSDKKLIKTIHLKAAVDTASEVKYIKAGGVLQSVLLDLK